VVLISVEEALSRVLDGAEPLPAHVVPLAKAYGRVLAADLVSLRTQPPAAVSAMDGYAVRSTDVASVPVHLKLVGEVAAGRPFAGTIGVGETARIFTGGVLPPGSDTVVIQENTQRRGDMITVTVPASQGRHVRPAGLDFAQGDMLLAKGRRLTGRDVALAASMNHPTVAVFRRPTVAMLATGDELVQPGQAPRPDRIVSSNGFALAAIARAEGAEALDLGIVPDDRDATMAAIRHARRAGADVLATTGGASVGDRDLVHDALVAEGMALSFWKVALRPGRPMMHGRVGDMRVLGLPGNPVSAFVCAYLFLAPLIRRLTGRTDLHAPRESAVLGRDLPENDERTDYLRATLARDADGNLVATPFQVQDSSMLVPLAKADCLIVRAPFATAARAGSSCDFVRLDC
jgi:molybdopterin molybdotransferase